MIRNAVARTLSKAKRVLNWEPKVGLKEGLKLTMVYFEKAFKKEMREEWLGNRNPTRGN